MCSSGTCFSFEQHLIPCTLPQPKFKLHIRTASSIEKPNGHGGTGGRIKNPFPEAKPREIGDMKEGRVCSWLADSFTTLAKKSKCLGKEDLCH